MTFSFGRGTKVFYPLDNDKYTTFDFVQNSEFNYPHSYHFAHDFYGKSNEDNYYVFVEEPTSLIGFYNEMKSNSPSDWNKISDQAKEKIAKLKIEDNPLLFIFRIKK